jgi:hypothetical protein
VRIELRELVSGQEEEIIKGKVIGRGLKMEPFS